MRFYGFEQNFVLGSVGIELNNHAVFCSGRVAVSCALKCVDQLIVLLANLLQLQFFVVGNRLLSSNGAVSQSHHERPVLCLNCLKLHSFILLDQVLASCHFC